MRKNQMIFTLSVLLLAAAGCPPLSVRKEQIAYPNSVKSYRADGGAVISNLRYGKSDELKTICVAPPPQAGPNLSLNIKHKGKVNVLDYVEIENDNSIEVARTLAKLYEQNERTLFLQFSLYRLCEAYMNGMLDERTYAEVLEGRATDALEQHQAAVMVATAADGTVKDAAAQAQALDAELIEAKTSLAAAEARDAALAELKLRRIDDLKRPDAALGKDALARKPDILAKNAEARGQTVAAAQGAVNTLLDRQKTIVGSRVAAEEAKLDADSKASALGKTANHLDALAHQARVQETNERARIKGLPPDQQQQALQQLNRKHYTQLFGQVMQTAERLASTQAEVARAEADRAKAEAEKARLDAVKASTSEAVKEMEKELKALKSQIVDAAVNRITAPDSSSKEKDAEKKP